MKPWRENAEPHRDVLEGTFQQSEFAADLTAVRTGKATPEYQDARAFFERTFITEGMRLLLTQVAQRLAGQGGEPVVQLQTAFGGGKTHTLLAVYHLATRQCPLSDLAGIPALVDQAGLMDIPCTRVAVLDGNEFNPSQAWMRGDQPVKTLWGELAWQLGGADAFALVAAADANGTSPGKSTLRDLLERHAPCVILVDELVAYIRNFHVGPLMSGGSYDSNFSFIQALTEAVKLVPRAILLASLPESEVEAGGQLGLVALRALEKTFGRVQALWKPVATEEAFEIVRRRLFEPVRDLKLRDQVCRAFADAYVAEGNRLPTETQEGRYFDRLIRAYPIHPEVFARLYEDWSSIDGFQRTRGVLKLMAKVIYRLWKDDNKDLMILPGSLPLYDGNTRAELLYYLPAGWDPVVEKDVDGEGAETTDLESREPRFGPCSAARRVARTVFLGSAPSSIATKPGIRGLDRARVLLGCLQPGQPSSVYSDALNRLADLLHYLQSSGDKTLEATRFWFGTQANLRREMEDRKRRFDDASEVRKKIAEVLKKVVDKGSLFEGVHIFVPHSDIKDDEALRLVVLLPEVFYASKEPRIAAQAVLDYVRNNGSQPRHRWNRLLFLAADQGTVARLKDATRTALAWASIVEDVKEGRLNIDQIHKKQADKELQTAEDVLPRVARECYKWLLCPFQAVPTDPAPTVEAHSLNTTGPSLSKELEQVCKDNELIITAWSPVHLRTLLQGLYWKDGQAAVRALAFWEDSLRYLYLPRLRTRSVLEQALQSGAGGRDFFGTAQGQRDGTYEGFQFGHGPVVLHDTLVLIEPAAAAAYEEAHRPPPPAPVPSPVPALPGSSGGPPPGPTPSFPPFPAIMKKAVSFHGNADVAAVTAKMRLVKLTEEIISVLCSDPNASVKVTLEISADFPGGVSDHIKRTVSENAQPAGLKSIDWE